MSTARAVKLSKKRTINLTTTSILLILFSLALVKVHLVVKATVLGYKIGELKTHESQLLRKRSLLATKLATLTTKSNLEELLGK